ncbi:13009_t:CDS:2, partial [Cetraspora pellucida]
QGRFKTQNEIREVTESQEESALMMHEVDEIDEVDQEENAKNKNINILFEIEASNNMQSLFDIKASSNVLLLDVEASNNISLLNVETSSNVLLLDDKTSSNVSLLNVETSSNVLLLDVSTSSNNILFDASISNNVSLLLDDEVVANESLSQQTQATIHNFFTPSTNTIKLYKRLEEVNGKMEASFEVAQSVWNKGDYMARCVWKWREHYIEIGKLLASQQGKHVKNKGLYNNKEFPKSCQEWLQQQTPEFHSPGALKSYLEGSLFPKMPD